MVFRLRHILLTTLVLLCGISASAASVHLSVQSVRGKRDIGVGDLFYISYEVNDIEEAPDRPTNVPGAKIMYFERTGQSSRFTSVNGKTSQSYSFTYTLTLKAVKEGQFTYGPVTIGGVKSNSVNYSIGAQAAAAQPSAPDQSSGQSSSRDAQNSSEGPRFIGKGDGNLFLKADVSKSTAYEQEALVYTVKLYTTYDAIKFIGATAAPKFEGFVVEESKDISTSLEYETYNGKTYATAIIARYIIFPQMQGQLKVLGNTYTVSVDEREYYHDPFWGNMSVPKPLQLNVTPNDLSINVKALPSPVPSNFSGGVGQFKITSELPSQNFLSNQAASVVYTVTGTGNLKYVKLPDLNALYPAQLEVYSPTPEVTANVGRTNVSGTAKFDYSFMPLEPGTFTIPSVDLVYFNPQSGRYETSTARGYTVNVGKGKGSEKSQTRGMLAFHPQLMKVGSDLSFHHTPYVKKFGYWLLYIIPVLILLGTSVYYRAYLKANADLLAVKSRKASKVARMRLRKAAICMKKRETDKFYDEMLAAIWGYLGDKLRIPMSELNRQNVSEKLTAEGMDAARIEGLIALIDECEFAKYAPASTKADMQPVYDKGAEVINGLEEAFKQIKQEKK
ncbi:MAG: BatD family protein [Muribaculaceae bacterium]|nr:BatD family protein [Muribaculaceae bacterium]